MCSILSNAFQGVLVTETRSPCLCRSYACTLGPAPGTACTVQLSGVQLAADDRLALMSGAGGGTVASMQSSGTCASAEFAAGHTQNPVTESACAQRCHSMSTLIVTITGLQVQTTCHFCLSMGWL